MKCEKCGKEVESLISGRCKPCNKEFMAKKIIKWKEEQNAKLAA